jgi:hypothetical protein
MRRLLVSTFVALCVIVVAASPALASGNAVPPGSKAFGASLETWRDRFGQWAFGSSTNPIFSGVCGEVVDGAFFFNVAIEPGFEVDCAIPSGTPLLASPGGSFEWVGNTAADLIASVDNSIANTPVTDPRIVLDGRELAIDDTRVKTGAFTINLEEGNFLSAIDPDVVGNTWQIALGGWFVRMTPLSPGHHEMVMSDVIAGDLFDATFHITVG